MKFSCIWLQLRYVFGSPNGFFGYVHGHTVYFPVWLEICGCSLFLCLLLCCFDVVPSCVSGRCWTGGRQRWADPTRPTHGNHLLVTICVWDREVYLCSTSQPLLIYATKTVAVKRQIFSIHSKKQCVFVGEQNTEKIHLILFFINIKIRSLNNP